MDTTKGGGDEEKLKNKVHTDVKYFHGELRNFFEKDENQQTDETKAAIQKEFHYLTNRFNEEFVRVFGPSNMRGASSGLGKVAGMVGAVHNFKIDMNIFFERMQAKKLNKLEIYGKLSFFENLFETEFRRRFEPLSRNAFVEQLDFGLSTAEATEAIVELVLSLDEKP